MANIVMDSTWIPTIQHVHVTGDGVIHADVSWTDSSTAAAITEVIPVAWLKSTLPSMTRNFAYDPQLSLRPFPRLNRVYGRYTYVCPKSAQATLIGSDPSVPVLPNGFLVPAVQHLDSVLRRLVTTTEEATVIIPPMDQHQLVRYRHTRIFRVRSAFIADPRILSWGTETGTDSE